MPFPTLGRVRARIPHRRLSSSQRPTAEKDAASGGRRARALAPQHVAAATADPIVDSNEVGTTAPHADEPPDGPKRLFKDDFIENIAGKWILTRKIRGTTVENAVKVEWVLNHQFLELHMKDVANPPAYEAIVLIGYSYDDKRYIAHWCDTFGGKFSAKGFGQRSGDSIRVPLRVSRRPILQHVHLG